MVELQCVGGTVLKYLCFGGIYAYIFQYMHWNNYMVELQCVGGTMC